MGIHTVRLPPIAAMITSPTANPTPILTPILIGTAPLLLPANRKLQKRLLFAVVYRTIDAPGGTSKPCVTGRPVGLAGNQYALRG